MRRFVGAVFFSALGAAVFAGTARAELINIFVNGTVTANPVTVGPYAGVPVCTSVQYTIPIDTAEVQFTAGTTTQYTYHRELGEFFVDGVGTVNGNPGSSFFSFSGGDAFYELRAGSLPIPGGPQSTLRFDFRGDSANPFNNTADLASNAGVYTAAPFNLMSQFQLEVLNAQFQFENMLFGVTSITITPEPGSLAMLAVAAMALKRRRRW
jgi:hypothetical protein